MIMLENLIKQYQNNIYKIYGKYYNFSNEKYKLNFTKFYYKLLENNFFNGLFNMYDFLKCQGQIIFPGQLSTQKVFKKYQEYLENKDITLTFKNFSDIKEVIKEDIIKIKEVLKEYNIKYNHFFSYKKDEKDVFTIGLFYTIHNIISPYISCYDQKFYDNFILLPNDFLLEYENWFNNTIFSLRKKLHSEKPEFEKKIIEIVNSLKEKL